MTRHRSKVTGNDDFVTLFIATHKDQHRAFFVIHHQPFKAVRVKIQFMHCFMVAVGEVQIAHQTLDTVVPVIAAFQQMPVEAGVMVPLAALGKFVPHEQQFLARECPHPAVVGAQVSEFLPCVARHPIENRFFTVDHFIMRQRQDEVFSVVVEHPEGQFIVMILTINRVELHVVQGVMHPAEVPLVPEAQTAHVLRTRNAREIGRLLRHCHRTGNLLTKNTVGIPQEFNRFKIHAPAKFVRDPLPLFTAVVAVNH